MSSVVYGLFSRDVEGGGIEARRFGVFDSLRRNGMLEKHCRMAVGLLGLLSAYLLPFLYLLYLLTCVGRPFPKRGEKRDEWEDFGGAACVEREKRERILVKKTIPL